MKKIKSIAMVWEQISWGGVDSFISYLLNSKHFNDISITIYTNKNNEGLERFKKNINTKLVNIIEYNSLLEIWEGVQLQTLKEKFLKGQKKDIPVCDACDYMQQFSDCDELDNSKEILLNQYSH